MTRITAVTVGLILVITACGDPFDTPDAAGGELSASVERGTTDVEWEQLALSKLQERFRFEGPTRTVLSRTLTSSEISDMPCGSHCPSQSYYVLILEGSFFSTVGPTDTPTVVPSTPYRFAGTVIDLSSRSAIEMFASTDSRDVRMKFPDADVD
jgi:hypothetical protein